MIKKKVLFLSSRLPYPANDGRSATLLQYIEMLSKYCDISLVSFNNDKDVSRQPTYLKFVEELKYPSFLKKMKNVIWLSFFKGFPLQIAGVYSKKSQKKFDEIVNAYKPDIIICDMLRTSLYLRKCKYKCEKILDMDDMLSNRYYLSINSKEDALGQFKDSLPKIFVKLVNFFHLNKLMLKIEAKKMRKNEIKSTKYFEKIIFVSPVEAHKFNDMTKKNNAFSWPVCVKMEDKNSIDNIEIISNRLCFLGNMDAVQNQSTLKYICENIFPKLEGQYELLVIGKCSQENMELFSKYHFVKFTGFVDSVLPYVKSSLCMIAPIQYGSGIKIKILDSMRFGVPIITSNIGVEGLEVQNGVELFIANDEDYNQIIFNLKNDLNYRNIIINNAFKYIAKKHSYELGEKVLLDKILEVNNDN